MMVVDNMKYTSRAKRSWKNAYGQSWVALFSWAALLSMIITVTVSILWESFSKTQKDKPLKNKTYKYPTYVFDFKIAMAERKKAFEDYASPSSSIDYIERRSGLSLQEFWDLYDAKWPVLITDVVPTWPASKWTAKYFNETYGEERVAMKSVTGTMENDAQGLALPLHLFIAHTNVSSPYFWTYITDELFIPTRPELLQQIYTEEDFFTLFPKEIRPWECMLLWGTAHSRSTLHIDPYNWTGTNAVIKGTKMWKLFPPGQDHLLYIIPDTRCGFPLECNKYNSQVDAFVPDLQRFPLFQSAHYLEVEQKAGEMLFIPTGWFHQAFNSEETLAISGQIMNRNNYRFVLEEIIKAGNLKRSRLPAGFHNLLPPDQVSIFMSLLPQKLLKKGKQWTENYINQIRQTGPSTKPAV